MAILRNELAFSAWADAFPALRRAHEEFGEWSKGGIHAIWKPPARPEGPRVRRLAGHWDAMFGNATFVDPESSADPPLFRRSLRDLLGALPEDTPPVPSPRHEGDNWCGAVLRARRGLRFTEIAANWVVPEREAGQRVLPSLAGPLPRPPRGSAWIGFDGASLASRAMPQIGVSFDLPVRDGREEAFAWFQWWIRDRWSPPLQLKGLAVAPGDKVFCSLIAVSSTKVQAYIRNDRTRRIAALEAKAPDFGHAIGLRQGDDIRVAGGTAEWIVERPADPEAIDLDRQLYPLPAFGRLDFGGCVALAAPAPGAPGEELTPRDARLLCMTARLDQPRRAVVIARAAMRGRPPDGLRIERRPR